ncbi:uncharacterized protein LOC132716592, partial [Ruditapes philippinarum]|uniref:uncharacterized protein LOC132716592 n=1 Tax=Ruditapes philippinarum TaxID=129788 RepID=UPI00295C29FE
MRPIHYAAAYGRTAIFEKLMMNGGIKLMPSLWNCLDLAIDNEHEETVIKMLSIDTVDWENMMISKSWVDQQSGIGFIDTPFRKLIRNMPDVARLVLNKYTTIEGSKEFKVLFDFTLMDIESRLNMQCCNRYTFIASE